MASRESALSPAAERARSITLSLKESPSRRGLSGLGEDGVVRSFNSGGEVIDYKQLDPSQIEDAIELYTELNRPRGKEEAEQTRKKMEEIYRQVDGRTVSKEKCEKPDRKLIPPHLLGEKVERRRDNSPVENMSNGDSKH